MSIPATRETQQDILSLLNQAQSLIGDAAELACPVRGWSKEWNKLQNQYDAIKATWHSINNAKVEPNDERMHHYQRRRTSTTGLVL